MGNNLLSRPLSQGRGDVQNELLTSIVLFLKEEDRPKKPRFLLMACAEEGKYFKTVSAVRLAVRYRGDYGKLQAVVRQRNGTILFEARSDDQVKKIMKPSRLLASRW